MSYCRTENVIDALDEWLNENCPRTASRFPIPAMRELRNGTFIKPAH